MSLAYDLRVIRAVAVNDIRGSLVDRTFTILSILTPINFLFLMILFVLSGGQAPTAVVLQDNGPYAREFVAAMERSQSFIIQETTAARAQDLLRQGRIVAIVTVPANFDADVQSGTPIDLPVVVNNLNVDFTNDIRRAVPLSITSFYGEEFPNRVVVKAAETDLQPRDTNYIQYLSVSILVVGLMLGGLLQAGSNAAREHERGTIKELLLSPAARWAIETGKVVGAAVLNLISAAIVLAVVTLVLGVRPLSFSEMVGFSLLLIAMFVAFGTLIGTLARNRRTVIPLSMGTALPLFFMSGAFGPANWGSPVLAAIARASPVYYGIAVFQFAFHGFTTTPSSVVANTLILVGFVIAAILLSAFVLRHASVAH